MSNKQIKPGIGIDELIFGISKSDALKLLGNPFEIDKYSLSNTEKDLIETWYYNDLGINLSFDEEENWKLGLITIQYEDYILNNNIFIGQKKEKILNELNNLKITDLVYEDHSSVEPTHELYSSETLGVNFWFNYNKLTEIQIGPLFIDDETIKWPD